MLSLLLSSLDLLVDRATRAKKATRRMAELSDRLSMTVLIPVYGETLLFRLIFMCRLTYIVHVSYVVLINTRGV